jgi:hypothetical protein
MQLAMLLVAFSIRLTRIPLVFCVLSDSIKLVGIAYVRSNRKK